MPYLNDLELSTVYLERIQEVYDLYRNICPEEITNIFITDYTTNEGKMQLETLWFFSDSYCMEAKQCFTNQEAFDIAYFNKSIERIVIKKQNYDFKKATLKSRLNIEIKIKGDIFGLFKASQYNCDNLKNIFLTQLKPNLIS